MNYDKPDLHHEMRQNAQDTPIVLYFHLHNELWK